MEWMLKNNSQCLISFKVTTPGEHPGSHGLIETKAHANHLLIAFY